MTVRNQRSRWKRTPGTYYWYCDDLPGWCVTSSFAPDRFGVYRRVFFARYRDVTVGEVCQTSRPERVMDELDDLLGQVYRSPLPDA